MPVRTHSIFDRRANDDRYQKLKARLVDEWSGRPGEEPLPDILEERDARSRVIHVTVTWDEWSDLDAQTRSELIVDALQAVKGEAAVVELTLAMGLTRAEAARLARAGNG
ncbi:MAG TPA: hypothetical protein VIV60_37480 [Polyangiaceae bacterium]